MSNPVDIFFRIDLLIFKRKKNKSREKRRMNSERNERGTKNREKQIYTEKE